MSSARESARESARASSRASSRDSAGDSALDPAVRQLLAELDTLSGPDSQKLSELTPEQTRVWYRVLRGILGGAVAPPAVAAVRDDSVARGAQRVPVRVYDTAASRTGARRVVVHMHGGGWVVGDLDSADLLARSAARDLDARVVSVGYRLAPEHPFPAAYEDCAAVLAAVSREHPRARVAVMGDSAGATLAAALAAASRHRAELRVDAQLLLYPALDPSMRSASMREFADGYVLTRADMAYYWAGYLRDPHDGADPRATPAAAADLSGMPATVLATAGFDPLRDEGRAYATRLVAAGVPTVFLPFPALVHGFADMVGRVPAARAALRAVLAAFAQAVTPVGTPVAPPVAAPIPRTPAGPAGPAAPVAPAVPDLPDADRLAGDPD